VLVTHLHGDHFGGLPFLVLDAQHRAEWTDTHLDVADDADLFLCEAYVRAKEVPYHLTFERVRAERDRFGAERVAVTHMREDVLSGLPDLLDGTGIEAVEDGTTFDL
jgi:ribonuclease BN (tRNA processing enzyme)